MQRVRLKFNGKLSTLSGRASGCYDDDVLIDENWNVGGEQMANCVCGERERMREREK